MVKSSEIIDLLKKANKEKLGQFVFTRNGKTYGCVWSKGKWSAPMEIYNFGEI